MYTAAELKEKLGRYYISRIHAKASQATYKQVRNVLAGEHDSKDIILDVMKAAGEAMKEANEVEAMNKLITGNKAA